MNLRRSAPSLALLSTLAAAGCSGDDSGGGSTSGAASIGPGPGGPGGARGTTRGGGGGTECSGESLGASEGGSSGGFKFDVGAVSGFDLPEEPEPPAIPATCEEALAGGSTVGCRFFAVDMDSHDLAEGQQFAVAVANVQLAGDATVTIEVKEGGGWQTIAGPQAIAPLGLATFPLPARSTDDSAVRAGGAYRISADLPVVAYQFNPVDGASSYLSDASMLYPVAALDTINDVVG